MKKEYDFSKMKGRKNPYAKKLKKQITIRLDEPVIEYFKKLAEENDISYQTLINLYLKDCANSEKKLVTKWLSAS
jgi:uncharacterized protein (DUF4415 family)